MWFRVSVLKLTVLADLFWAILILTLFTSILLFFIEIYILGRFKKPCFIGSFHRCFFVLLSCFVIPNISLSCPILFFSIFCIFLLAILLLFLAIIVLYWIVVMIFFYRLFWLFSFVFYLVLLNAMPVIFFNLFFILLDSF